MLSEQRRVVLSMISGYRTLSGDACIVTAGVIPMDLEIDWRRVMTVLKRDGYVAWRGKVIVRRGYKKRFKEEIVSMGQDR